MRFIKGFVLFEILILFLLSLIPLLWFKPQHIVIGVDSGYAVDYMKYFNQRTYTWLGSQNFGIDMSAEVGVVPYNAIPALVEYLGVSRFDVQKIVFIFWFFLILISIYSFLYYLFPKNDQWLARFSGVVLYSFNLHLYSFWLQGEQPILASYVLLPWFTLFLLRFVMGKSSAVKTAIYLNLVFVLFSSGGVRGLPLVGPVLLSSFAIILYFIILNFKSDGLNYVKKFLPLFIFGGLFFIFLNAYFLVPFISSFALQYGNQVAITGGIGGAIEWAKFISTYTSFTNLFRLHGDNNWYNKPYLWSWSYLTNPILISASFIYPILAFAAILFAKVKKERTIILLFTMVALLGFFFSAGAHPPLGFIYTLMMDKVPGFAAFRSGYYKFIPTVYLSFAVLVGYSLNYLINKLSSRFRIVVGVLSIVAILGYHYPYFTKTNFDFNKPFSTMVKIPQYVNDFAKMQNGLPDRYRTLVVPPPADAYNIKAFAWGYWGSYPIFPLITDRNFVVNDVFVFNENENRLITSMYNSLRSSDFKTFLTAARTTNVKYVLVTSDLAKDFFMSLSEDPKKYDPILTPQNNFKEIWKEGPWKLFEITNLDPNKTEAFSSVIINDTTDSIGSVLKANAIPFVNSETLHSVKLPISGEFKEYPCLSCHILEDTGEPPIGVVKVFPGSFLYALKLKGEKDIEKAVGSNQKIDALLGLSMKRVSEIDSLNYIPVKKESDWLVSSELLAFYWKNILKLYLGEYKNNYDYSILRKISKYLLPERNIVTNVINIRGLNKEQGLGKSLQKTVNLLNEIDKTLSKKLTEKNWREVFVYDISKSNNVLINPNTLATDDFGSPVSPSGYSINGTEYPYTGKTIESLTTGKKILYLFFDLPNLFSNAHVKNRLVDGNKRNCIESSIPNYSWTKKYLITVSVNDEDKGTMYIKREYNVFANQDLVTQPKSSPDYDIAVDTNTFRTGKFQYQFSGKANDKSAIIYFCSNSDPALVFKDIVVSELIHPQLYSFEKKQELENQPPQTSFSKMSPTLYSVMVSGAKNPFVLSFSERFSPLWEAYIGNEKIDKHFLLNGFANGWYIKKEGDYSIRLIFKPQKEVELGVAVTVITFFSLAVFSLSQVVKNEKNKK